MLCFIPLWLKGRWCFWASCLPAGEFAFLNNCIMVQVAELLQYKQKPQLSFTCCRSNKYLIISANLALYAMNKHFQMWLYSSCKKKQFKKNHKIAQKNLKLLDVYDKSILVLDSPGTLVRHSTVPQFTMVLHSYSTLFSPVIFGLTLKHALHFSQKVINNCSLINVFNYFPSNSKALRKIFSCLKDKTTLNMHWFIGHS